MKRIALYLGIAAALVASCSVKEKDFNVVQPESTVFFASFEQPAVEETKVYVNDDLMLRWTADDRISLFERLTYNRELRFIGETGESEGKFDFVGSGGSGSIIPDIISVYPYQASTTISSDEVLTLTLPAEQSYAPRSFGLGANTAVSVTSTGFLVFKNVCGYLRVSLYGEGVSVSSITLKGNQGEKIAGTATVTMPLNGLPSVVMAADASTEITLTCAEPVALGATAEESVDFWFVVPPVTFSQGFTVTVNHQGGSMTKSTDKSVTIKRNYLSKMAPVDVNAQPATAKTYRISHLWLWGGTGPEYSGTKVIDLLAVPNYFNNDDNRGVTALKDNYYQIGADGTFTNYAGEDGRNWWFVYSGSVNPETHKNLDLRKFYDVLPLSTGKFALDGSTVTLTRADGTSTQATWVGPGTYTMPNTKPEKTVTIETQALMFEITGGKDNWGDYMYTDYQVIAGKPRALFVELEQLPADFVVPEASRTTDADFKYIPPDDPNPEFDLTKLPGKWNVYGGNSSPFGIWVLGGSGTSAAFVSPIEKTWDWDDTIYRESDNEMVIKVSSMGATSATGTTNWWAGNDGKFWNYIWKNTAASDLSEYYGTDLSQYYDQIPKGEKEFSLDFATMTVTLGNGHKAKLLTPGTHVFKGTEDLYFEKTLVVPDGCFALWFHLMDPIPPTSFRDRDIDRFMFAPLEYIIIFEKVE